ncbi:MAG: holo-ACP synthase [Erysipelotrichaceae bacterium]|nr:holo-ACP synthase [Erysipelotrichaceae bacterium]
MQGIGVDIIELDRLNLSHESFIHKVLTDKEFQVYSSLKSDQRKKEYLGGRFAAKEAYLKAKRKGLGEISFQQIEILNDDTGCPYLNDKQALISISHEKNYAIAFVIIK